MNKPVIQPSKGWLKKPKGLPELVEELDVSAIVKSILKTYPYMKHSKFPLDVLVRSFIYAKIRDISCCYRLAYLLNKNISSAKALGFRTHLRYDNLWLRIILPTGNTLESFKKRLSDREWSMIQNLADEVYIKISKEASQ